jgi:uncharacterized protein involved in exopolysaccharide biosynthesis
MHASGAQTGLSPSSIFRVLRRRKLYLLLPILVLTPAVYFYTRTLPER